MYINENTKISALIKHNPKSIDAIVSISTNFEKLRNPILRKVLASRVSIKQAAKIGESTVEIFYRELIPLGFEIKTTEEKDKKEVESTSNYFQDLDEGNIVDLDVRGILKEGKDPFNKIMEALSTLSDNSALRIINTFEPTPLISILAKKGYSYNTVVVEKQLVHTYFKKKGKLNNSETKEIIQDNGSEEVTTILKSFGTNVREVDVRLLEMPLPMASILNELSELPDDHLLYVHHKKIPQFLFPELTERGYQWRVQINSEDNIKLIIFK